MEISLPDKIIRIAFVALLAIVLALVITGAVMDSQHTSEVTELQNTIATQSKTIEVKEGLYSKLAVQSKDLSALLDKKDEQIKLLQKDLKKNGEDLLTANSLVLTWKRAYLATVAGHQTDIPPTPGTEGVVRKRVDFEKDFGYIGAFGFTLTDPPEATIQVQQNRPLKLTVTVSQNDKGAWSSRTTSSEENVQVDITLAAVNPYMLEPKWYENIGISAELGAGTGFLAGVGATYKIGKFEVGPKGWFTVTGPVSGFVGAQLLWHPFAR